ncbi:MAG: DUF1640 domain-containing protein, partial [Candidatus Dadabacteria bacterium]
FKDDEVKARALAEAFDRLEHRIPANVATEEHLETTKLALQKEIEQLRADLTKDIEQVRADLTARIEENRLSIEQVRAEIARTHASTVRWVTGLLIAQAGVIVALIKILP